MVQKTVFLSMEPSGTVADVTEIRERGGEQQQEKSAPLSG